MDQIIDYFITYFSSTDDSPVFIFMVIFALIFLICKGVVYLIKNRTAIKTFVNNVYYRRRHQEELKEKFENTCDTTEENAKEIQEMKDNYVGYRAQSLTIQRQFSEAIQALQEKANENDVDIRETHDDIVGIKDALIEMMNDRITQKCVYYTSRRGIPEDEIDNFQRMFDVYVQIGGNHGLERRFNKTMELQIIPHDQEG